MKFHHSLRFRIVIAFCLFGAILGGVFATIVFYSLDMIDDHLVNNRLIREVDYFLDQYHKQQIFPLPTSPHISAYIGTAAIPEQARALVRPMPEGFHEIYLEGEEIHVAVKVVPELIDPLYLFYEVSALEFTEKRKLNIALVLAGSIVLVVGLGAWLGLLVSRKVIAPVVHLADWVNRCAPDHLPTNISQSFYNDEVGVLAKTLEKSMQRVKDLVEREKQFTRDASHELRTPVTVAKGALELLKGQLGDQDGAARRPLKRIERAVSEMEATIESLLVLARGEASVDDHQKCEVLPVVKEAIENHRHIMGDKPVTIEYLAECNPVIAAPATILRIVMTNLLQNAFCHTVEGKITVHICSSSVVISDTGSGIAACDLPKVTEPHVRGDKSRGFGLGLAIVKRVCERFDWQFEIESELGKGTSVRLLFEPSRV